MSERGRSWPKENSNKKEKLAAGLFLQLSGGFPTDEVHLVFIKKLWGVSKCVHVLQEVTTTKFCVVSSFLESWIVIELLRTTIHEFLPWVGTWGLAVNW